MSTWSFCKEPTNKIGSVYTNLQDWISLYKPYSDKNAIKNRLELPKKAESWLSPTELLGVYEDAYYGQAKIFMEGSKIMFRMGEGSRFVSELKALGKSNYRLRFKDRFLPDGIITFNINSGATVDGFNIDLPNPDFHFYNLSFKKKD